MSLTQLSAWRIATEFEPKLPLRELRERKFDLHCGCGTSFLKCAPRSCKGCCCRKGMTIASLKLPNISKPAQKMGSRGA